jgi:hypothetical protein
VTAPRLTPAAEDQHPRLDLGRSADDLDG